MCYHRLFAGFLPQSNIIVAERLPVTFESEHRLQSKRGVLGFGNERKDFLFGRSGSFIGDFCEEVFTAQPGFFGPLSKDVFYFIFEHRRHPDDSGDSAFSGDEFFRADVVFGMSDEIYTLCSTYLFIDTAKIIKLDVNKATFKEINAHPYISYDQTKVICNTRRSLKFFSYDNFLHCGAFDSMQIKKVLVYLKFN